MCAVGWDAWKELEQRQHIELRRAPILPDHGRIYRRVGTRSTVIVLHCSLTQRERTAALTHELVHDERDILYDPTTPRALIEKEEAAVRREVAWRLCPPAELDRRIRTAVDAGAEVSASVVADWIDTTIAVAAEALRSHEIAAARQRHPTARTIPRARAA